MASGVYPRCLANMANKLVDMSAGDTVNCLLMAVGHAYNKAHNTYADVIANELPAAGTYTAGGKPVATPTVTQGATSVKLDGDDVEWAGATFSAYHGVLYDDTLAGDDLIASFDFGGVQTVTGATFRIVWNALGIITLTP